MRRRGVFTSRVVVLAIVFIVLSVGAAFARAADDDIPGVALQGSGGTVRDSLTETTAVGPGNVPLWDIDDVYQFRLAYNERFEATMTPPPDADFDLYLIAPGTRRLSVAFTRPFTPILRASEGATGAVERISYVSDRSSTATFYVHVAQQFDGSGPYTLVWRRTQLPTPDIMSTAPVIVRFGGSASATGTALVAGRPMVGFAVQIRQRPYGSTTWTRVASTKTAADGSFTLQAKPAKRTDYRIQSTWSVTQDGSAVGYGIGPVMTVWPRAYLPAPKAPSRATFGKAFTVSGALKPAHSRGSGHVRVLVARKSGSGWRVYRAVPARHSSTGWSASLKLPKGTFQLRASVPTDTLHAATVSSPRTVTVK
ncbi:MAG: hypothetical protein U1E26_03785 [Coriobacteriia bacterium]|nr:hypothetical protein [Coriobacteriia bacterium]